MKQTTSPPTPRSSAVLLVIRPPEVERIAVPMPPEHARQAILPSVHAAAGLRDPLQVGDDPLAVTAELQLHDERVERAVLLLVLLPALKSSALTTRKSLM